MSWKRASRSSATWPASFTRRSRAIRIRFSRPVRISSTAANCPVRLIDSRTSAGCVATSKPLTVAVPASAFSSVDRIFTTVVLPAPLEPSRAKMLPRATSKSTPRSTCSSSYDFSRACTWIAGPRTCSVVIWISMDMTTACRVDAASRSTPCEQGAQSVQVPGSGVRADPSLAHGLPRDFTQDRRLVGQLRSRCPGCTLYRLQIRANCNLLSGRVAE